METHEFGVKVGPKCLDRLGRPQAMVCVIGNKSRVAHPFFVITKRLYTFRSQHYTPDTDPTSIKVCVPLEVREQEQNKSRWSPLIAGFSESEAENRIQVKVPFTLLTRVFNRLILSLQNLRVTRSEKHLQDRAWNDGRH